VHYGCGGTWQLLWQYLHGHGGTTRWCAAYVGGHGEQRNLQQDQPGYLRELPWVPLGLLLVLQDGSQGASPGPSTGPSSPGVDPVSSYILHCFLFSLVISLIIQCYRLLSLHGSWRLILQSIERWNLTRRLFECLLLLFLIQQQSQLVQYWLSMKRINDGQHWSSIG
jgi:hypothetical protein